MGKTLAHKLIHSHLLDGRMVAGEEIGLRIDQTLTQDATGTMVMLELEAMGVKRAKTEVSCQYVDHNIVQDDFKNPDDHLFLWSAARRFGLCFSKPGNGVSHPVHMERLGRPGKTLLGSDSHTCAAGSLGMLAMGAGGLEVALAIAGEPFFVKMPTILGVKLTGKLPEWVSAKDLILELLRRYGVSGGVGKIIEYYGPGIENLSAMDRHVVANMGAELGATTSLFPADKQIGQFLARHGREDHYVPLEADPDCLYDEHEEIDMGELEPLIACPSSPGNVVPVREVAGQEVFQSMIGSSANPGVRDFAVPAMIIHNRTSQDQLSLDINPSSRQVLQTLVEEGYLASLIQAGARIHQAGCNGCIGMGQAPASGRISLRTNPRNFPGRSGTKEDQVYLCSPETAIASALTGVITDPRDLHKRHGIAYPHYKEPSKITCVDALARPVEEQIGTQELIMGANIKPLPQFDPVPSSVRGPVLLKMGDNISTDGILPAGAKVLPLRSNIPEISKYTFYQIDPTYYERAIVYQEKGSILVAGRNYGQGSSREHAAIAPRYLGVQVVLAKGYARIHRKNLINFGIVPLLFEKGSADYDRIEALEELAVTDLVGAIRARKREVEVICHGSNHRFQAVIELSERETESILAGGLINLTLSKQKGGSSR